MVKTEKVIRTRYGRVTIRQNTGIFFDTVIVEAVTPEYTGAIAEIVIRRE